MVISRGVPRAEEPIWWEPALVHNPDPDSDDDDDHHQQQPSPSPCHNGPLRQAYEELKSLFGEDLPRFMILIFNGLDELEQGGTSLAEELKKQHPKLRRVLVEAQGRYIGFNNQVGLFFFVVYTHLHTDMDSQK